MTDTTATDANHPTPAAPKQQPEAKPQTETDWQAKFEAQQKVNRDLEGKLNGLRDTQQAQSDALAKALGLKPEETSDVQALASQVQALQAQFAETQHDNQVLLVAKEHGITEQSDLDLLKSVKDETTMRTLAARIAAASPGVPGTPQPDLSQGGTGAGVPALNGDGLESALRSKLGI
jgi:hypothetical protein